MIKHLSNMKICSSFAFSVLMMGVGVCARAQEFANGTLDGEIIGVSSMPFGWEAVPHTDKACHADEEFETTPDLANELGFKVVEGIRGKAKTGTSFVAGLDYGVGKHHEGIMQKLTGLERGQTYSISFYQAVIKQFNALDTSGSWSVYVDDELIAVTQPSSSHLHFNALDLQWDLRTVEFVASSRSHWIKFMPTDDDNIFNATDENGNLRMGIDGIELVEGIIEDVVDTVLVVEELKDTVVKDVATIDSSAQNTFDENTEIVKIPDTTKLDVIKLVAEIDPKTDSVHFVLKEPKEVIFQRPGPIDFKIVAEMDLNLQPNPTMGSFRVVTKEHDYTLTITDMRGRVIMKKENCTYEEAISLNRDGHFLVIMTKGRYKAAKKLIVQS